MNRPRRIVICIVFGLISVYGFGQSQSEGHTHEKCGTDHFTELIYKNYPRAREAADQAQNSLEEFTMDYQGDSRGSEPRIIPIVFHVVHFGGDENISAEQIESAVEVLNEDFSASNPNLGSVDPAFTDIIGDVGFEFRLAQIDPDGNCTNGINRVLTASTANASSDIKGEVDGWPRDKYLNVWVVQSIESGGSPGTILGFATFPASVNSSQTAFLDGIVIRSDRTGRIGTAANNDPTTLSHEVGHWVNLCHTWGCATANGLSSNCNVDDEVEDTPNTIGYQDICPGNPTSCSSLDNVENFMDYSSCAVMFTAGQSQRMNSSLSSFVAQRNSLWTESNLQATGVLESPTICVADFETTDVPLICVGNSLEFADISFNGVQNRTWTFEGGSPATSSSANPVVTYNNPGTYTVTLLVSNPNGSMTVEKTDFVTVIEPGQNTLQFTESFESFTSLEPNDEFWTVVNPDESAVKWEIDQNVGYFSNQCIKVRGRSNSATISKEYLYSPTFDLSGLSENAVLNFWYSHARRSAATEDVLRIWISRDCGETWSLRRTVSGSNLPTVPQNVPGTWTPQSNDQWAEIEIDNITSTFLTDEFRIRFEFESNQGNNIYVDYINIFDGLTSSLGEIEVLGDFNVYPNPTSEDAAVTFRLDRNADMQIDLLDVSGRLVRQLSNGLRLPGNHVERIDLRTLPQGMYIIRLQANGQEITRRVAVI